MRADFGEIPEGSLLEADVCIVGAGPAGIAIARELAGSGLSVLLVESGGLEFEPEIQDLYRGINTREDFSLHKSRYRMLGGTTQVWGGWCTPLDESDFASKPWVPHSGWPLAQSDLLPFYRRAQPLFELGPYRYDAAEWDFGRASLAVLDPAKLRHALWQLSPPTHFGRAFLGELERAANVRLLLHASVTGIVTDEAGNRVVEIELRDLHGRSASVRPRACVVACGGIETARLLLASTARSPAGIGNTRDLVGRYFMEHPHPDAGGVLFAVEPAVLRPYLEHEWLGERIVLGFGPSPQAQERLGILNCSLALHGAIHHEPSAGMDALIKLSRAVEAREWPEDAGTHVMRILRDLDDVVREGYLRLRDRPVRGFRLVARTEVTPDPENRVTLTGERDALGMPRVKLDWRVHELDRVTVLRTVRLLAEELGRLELGHVAVNELLDEDSAAWSANLSWFGHHMGTTRMSEDPGSGVVDADCRVHGLANLYIASSSVFPTCGFANPTLTIVALAIRLADHLKGQAAAGRLAGGR